MIIELHYIEWRKEVGKNSFIFIFPKFKQSLKNRSEAEKILNPKINPLRPQEIKMINHVNYAMSIFKEDSEAKITRYETEMIKFYDLPGNMIERCIKFCKSFPCFCSLTQDDQIVLLKTYFTKFMSVKYTFYYSMEHDGFPMFHVSMHILY